MSGESLMNNSFDVMGQQFIQASPKFIDSLFKPTLLPVLGAIFILMAAYFIYRSGRK